MASRAVRAVTFLVYCLLYNCTKPRLEAINAALHATSSPALRHILYEPNPIVMYTTTLAHPSMHFKKALARHFRRAFRVATTRPALLLRSTWGHERVRRRFSNASSVAARSALRLDATAQELDLDYASVARYIVRRSAALEEGMSDSSTYVSSGVEGTVVDEREDEDKVRLLRPPLRTAHRSSSPLLGIHRPSNSRPST